MISRLLTVLKKDFKLLLRSKSSTLAVLFGPLLVVLLVGLVFTNAGDPELVVGLVAEDFENSGSYQQSLEDAFTVVPYDDGASCVQSVRQGATVSCVVLESGNPPRAVVHVDPSDVNVVYAVIDRITGQLEEQSSVLRGSFATTLLESVTKANVKLRDDVEQLSAADVLLQQQVDKTNELAEQLGGLQVDVEVVSRADVADAVDSAVNARDEYRSLLLEAIDGYESLAEEENDTRSLEDIEQIMLIMDDVDEDVEETGDSVFVELLSLVEDLSSEVAETEEQAQAYASQAAGIKNSIAIAHSDVSQVLASNRQVRDDLSGLDISRTDLTSPIRPVIEPVTSRDDDFGFVFPYFIALIIMFTSILLASTIIVRERQSAAFFRNFTTPAPEWLFVISTFLTTFIVLFVQLLIILVVAAFFITGLASSLATLVPILLLAVTFFALLGMLVGYIFKSQEGVMLAAIAISSVLLFVSDLVLPVETIPGVVQFIINANPMVLASQLMSASIVFGFGIPDLLTQFFVLALYSVIMFIAILIVQRLTRIRYFEISGTQERISAFLGEEEIPEGKELEIGEWVVASKEELLRALKLMDDEQYESVASHRHNRIADWVLDVYKDERLARQLRNKSRKGAIAVLEKEV